MADKRIDAFNGKFFLTPLAKELTIKAGKAVLIKHTLSDTSLRKFINEQMKRYRIRIGRHICTRTNTVVYNPYTGVPSVLYKCSAVSHSVNIFIYIDMNDEEYIVDAIKTQVEKGQITDSLWFVKPRVSILRPEIFRTLWEREERIEWTGKITINGTNTTARAVWGFRNGKFVNEVKIMPSKALYTLAIPMFAVYGCDVVVVNMIPFKWSNCAPIHAKVVNGPDKGSIIPACIPIVITKTRNTGLRIWGYVHRQAYSEYLHGASVSDNGGKFGELIKGMRNEFIQMMRELVLQKETERLLGPDTQGNEGDDREKRDRS